MPKGYWIGRITVSHPDLYQRYVDSNGPVFAKFGARFLVRSGRHEVAEGTARPRNIVVEFPSYDAALACWRSDEYQRVRALRLDAGEVDIVIVEGYGD